MMEYQMSLQRAGGGRSFKTYGSHYDKDHAPSIPQLVLEIQEYMKSIDTEEYPNLELNEAELGVLPLAMIMPDTWKNIPRQVANAVQELITSISQTRGSIENIKHYGIQVNKNQAKFIHDVL